jgi:hypothetical protein
LVKTAETMGILDSTSEKSKQADIDEILGFLAALEKVREESNIWRGTEEILLPFQLFI